MTAALYLQIMQARLNIRAAKLARGDNGEILTRGQLAAKVEQAHEKLNYLLDRVPREEHA